VFLHMHGREPVVGRPSPAYQRRVPGPGCVVMGPFADVRALAGRLLFRDCPRSGGHHRRGRYARTGRAAARTLGFVHNEPSGATTGRLCPPSFRCGGVLGDASRCCFPNLVFAELAVVSYRRQAEGARARLATLPLEEGRARGCVLSRRRASTSAAPGNRDVVAGQLADVDLTWADALLLRVLDHLKPLGEPSRASG